MTKQHKVEKQENVNSQIKQANKTKPTRNETNMMAAVAKMEQ